MPGNKNFLIKCWLSLVNPGAAVWEVTGLPETQAGFQRRVQKDSPLGEDRQGTVKDKMKALPGRGCASHCRGE